MYVINSLVNMSETAVSRDSAKPNLNHHVSQRFNLSVPSPSEHNVMSRGYATHVRNNDMVKCGKGSTVYVLG